MCSVFAKAEIPAKNVWRRESRGDSDLAAISHRLLHAIAGQVTVSAARRPRECAIFNELFKRETGLEPATPTLARLCSTN
jgi:hypothetical protein